MSTIQVFVFSILEDSLQLWKVAAITLNKQQRPSDKEWSSSLGLGVRLTTPHHKTQPVTKHKHEPRTWTDSLDTRHMRRNKDMKLGTWKVRSFYRAGSLVTVWISNYRLHLVGVQTSDGRAVATKPQENTHFSIDRGMRIKNWVQISFLC
jgi:hypothetical protein